MPHEFKARMTMQMLDIALCPSKEIIRTDHLVALFKQAVDEVRAEEARPAGDEDAFAAIVETGQMLQS